jgi:hypothetical protein
MAKISARGDRELKRYKHPEAGMSGDWRIAGDHERMEDEARADRFEAADDLRAEAAAEAWDELDPQERADTRAARAARSRRRRSSVTVKASDFLYGPVDHGDEDLPWPRCGRSRRSLTHGPGSSGRRAAPGGRRPTRAVPGGNAARLRDGRLEMAQRREGRCASPGGSLTDGPFACGGRGGSPNRAKAPSAAGPSSFRPGVR